MMMMMMMILKGRTLFVCMFASSILELLRQHEYMNLQAQGLEALAIFTRLSFFFDSGKSTWVHLEFGATTVHQKLPHTNLTCNEKEQQTCKPSWRSEEEEQEEEAPGLPPDQSPQICSALLRLTPQNGQDRRASDRGLACQTRGWWTDVY